MREPPPLRFSVDDAEAANDHWGFNCGPGALCAALSLTPDEARPHLGDFEKRGYTNPTLMTSALRSLGVPFVDLLAGQRPEGPGDPVPRWPTLGLVRIQWGGPWTREGVPMRARYRQTHWIASCETRPRAVYDVNAATWVAFTGWVEVLVPWFAAEVVPRADGTWWPTHMLEVQRA